MTDHEKQKSTIETTSTLQSSALTEHQGNKVDVKKLLAVVPPPSMLFAKEKKVKEKRIRLVYDTSTDKDEAKISKTLAIELNVKNYIEITVAGKKKFKFKALILDSLPNDIVYVNPEVMRIHGVADKSICTIRSAD